MQLHCSMTPCFHPLERFHTDGLAGCYCFMMESIPQPRNKNQFTVVAATETYHRGNFQYRETVVLEALFISSSVSKAKVNSETSEQRKNPMYRHTFISYRLPWAFTRDTGEKSLKPPKKFACCSSAVEILRKHVRNSLIEILRHASVFPFLPRKVDAENSTDDGVGESTNKVRTPASERFEEESSQMKISREGNLFAFNYFRISYLSRLWHTFYGFYAANIETFIESGRQIYDVLLYIIVDFTSARGMKLCAPHGLTGHVFILSFTFELWMSNIFRKLPPVEDYQEITLNLKPTRSTFRKRERCQSHCAGRQQIFFCILFVNT